jgi:hypothetical protein
MGYWTHRIGTENGDSCLGGAMHKQLALLASVLLKTPFLFPISTH